MKYKLSYIEHLIQCETCQGSVEPLTTLTLDCPGRSLTKIEEAFIVGGGLEYFKGKWWMPVGGA